jgi:hypothetical protein
MLETFSAPGACMITPQHPEDAAGGHCPCLAPKEGGDLMVQKGKARVSEELERKA